MARACAASNAGAHQARRVHSSLEIPLYERDVDAAARATQQHTPHMGGSASRGGSGASGAAAMRNQRDKNLTGELVGAGEAHRLR